MATLRPGCVRNGQSLRVRRSSGYRPQVDILEARTLLTGFYDVAVNYNRIFQVSDYYQSVYLTSPTAPNGNTNYPVPSSLPGRLYAISLDVAVDSNRPATIALNGVGWHGVYNEIGRATSDARQVGPGRSTHTLKILVQGDSSKPPANVAYWTGGGIGLGPYISVDPASIFHRGTYTFSNVVLTYWTTDSDPPPPPPDPDPVIDLLGSLNETIDPATEALNVSNYVTTVGLPASSDFQDVIADPDNFRIQIDDPKQAGQAQVKLEVFRTSDSTDAIYPFSEPAGQKRFDATYTLNQSQGAKFRGDFLRLVSDAADDAVQGNQTILVQLGDSVRVTYTSSSGKTVSKEIRVGRPTSENNNSTASQRTHDIREVKVNVVVFRNIRNTGPVATYQQVLANVESINERFAQSAIRVKIVGIDMGGEGNPGVTLPKGQGIFWGDGLRRSRVGAPLTEEEKALLNLKDSDGESVDIFYFDAFSFDSIGHFDESYATAFFWDGRPNERELMNSIVMTAVGSRRDLTAPHELMHILLNSGHRADPATALFRAGGTTPKSNVAGTKRIGPYPGADVGASDTEKIRIAAERLPGSATALGRMASSAIIRSTHSDVPIAVVATEAITEVRSDISKFSILNWVQEANRRWRKTLRV